MIHFTTKPPANAFKAVIGSRDDAKPPNKEIDEKLVITELPQSLTTVPGLVDTNDPLYQATHPRAGPITYPIVQVEFERVQTPLIIGIWILSASIAKIGKSLRCSTFLSV